MTNAELAQHLNQVVGLSGDRAVTVNVIRQWVSWKLLGKSMAHARMVGQNPVWQRNGTQLADAIRLAKLRQFGMTAQDQLICRCYLEGWTVETPHLKMAAAARLNVFQSRAARTRTTAIDLKPDSEISVVKVRAVRRQAGPLDDRFKGTAFELKNAEFIEVFRAMLSDAARPEALAVAIQPMLNGIFPDVSWSKSPIFKLLLNSLSGFLADPIQFAVTAHSTLGAARERDCKISRAIVNAILKIPEVTKAIAHIPEIPVSVVQVLPLMQNTFRDVVDSEWPTVIFLTVVHGVVKAENGKVELLEEIQSVKHNIGLLSKAFPL